LHVPQPPTLNPYTLPAYCETLGDDEQRAKCINTLARLGKEKRKAYSGLEVLENATDAREALERLESVARQLSACGGTKLMVDALAHLQEMQDRHPPRDDAAPPPPDATAKKRSEVRRTAPPAPCTADLAHSQRLRRCAHGCARCSTAWTQTRTAA